MQKSMQHFSVRDHKGAAIASVTVQKGAKERVRLSRHASRSAQMLLMCTPTQPHTQRGRVPVALSWLT